MEFITLTSIGGSTWSIRKDRIEMVINRFKFSQQELDSIPELQGMKSCAVIKLIGVDSDYLCRDSYESIMEQLQ